MTDTNFQGVSYQTPSFQILTFASEGTLCASNGNFSIDDFHPGDPMDDLEM